MDNIQTVADIILPAVRSIVAEAEEVNHWGDCGKIRTSLHEIAEKASLRKEEVLEVLTTHKENLALAVKDAFEDNILVKAEIQSDSVLIHVMRLITHIEESFPYM